MITKTTMAAGFAILATASVAIAAPAMNTGMNTGMKHQAGPMTLKDAQERSDKMFARMDANSDGKIDQADREARRAERFARLDTDKDGQISEAEYAAKHARHGMRGDQANAAGANTAGAKPAGDHARHRGHGMRGMGMGGGMIAAMADTNKDGAITRAEFDAGVKAHFARMDANADGMVSVEERKAAHEQMRAKFKAARDAKTAN